MDGSLEAPTAGGSSEAWTAILDFEQRYSLSLGVRALLSVRVSQPAGSTCIDEGMAAVMAAPCAAQNLSVLDA